MAIRELKVCLLGVSSDEAAGRRAGKTGQLFGEEAPRKIGGRAEACPLHTGGSRRSAEGLSLSFSSSRLTLGHLWACFRLDLISPLFPPFSLSALAEAKWCNPVGLRTDAPLLPGAPPAPSPVWNFSPFPFARWRLSRRSPERDGKTCLCAIPL